MKAVLYKQYGGPDVMELGDVPEPPLHIRDVRIAICSASINPIDFKIRGGAFKRVLKFPMPVVMGFDVSGVVTEVGMRATHFKLGDKVYACVQPGRMGTLAEEITAERTDVAPMPATLSFDEAASIPLAGLTAWQCLVMTLNLQAGQRVLIHAGAGGVGTLAIQIAKHLGAHVTTTASAPKHALLKELGADVCIDYTSENFTQRGRDFDAVLDAVGGDVLLKSFDVVKPGGMVVSIVSLPDEPTARRMGMNALVRLVLRFMNRRVNAAAKNAGVQYRFVSEMPNEAQLRRIGGLIDEGVIKPVIDSTYTLDTFAEAFATLEGGHATGKVVVHVQDEGEIDIPDARELRRARRHEQDKE